MYLSQENNYGEQVFRVHTPINMGNILKINLNSNVYIVKHTSLKDLSAYEHNSTCSLFNKLSLHFKIMLHPSVTSFKMGMF